MRTWTFEVVIWSENEATEYSADRIQGAVARMGDNAVVEVDLISDIESLRQ